MPFRLASFVLVVAMLLPSPVRAQTLSLTPVDPNCWDVALNAGSVWNRRADLSQWNPWYQTGALSAEVGRQWTTHLKTTVSVNMSGEGRVYASEAIPVLGQAFPGFRYSERYVRGSGVAGSVSYQFFENAWVQPCVTAGVGVTRQLEGIESPPQTVGRLVLPAVRSDARVFEARPFAGGGAKLYLTPNAFVRTDAQVSFGSRHSVHVVVSGGIGVDF